MNLINLYMSFFILLIQLLLIPIHVNKVLAGGQILSNFKKKYEIGSSIIDSVNDFANDIQTELLNPTRTYNQQDIKGFINSKRFVIKKFLFGSLLLNLEESQSNYEVIMDCLPKTQEENIKALKNKKFSLKRNNNNSNETINSSISDPSNSCLLPIRNKISYESRDRLIQFSLIIKTPAYKSKFVASKFNRFRNANSQPPLFSGILKLSPGYIRATFTAEILRMSNKEIYLKLVRVQTGIAGGKLYLSHLEYQSKNWLYKLLATFEKKWPKVFNYITSKFQKNVNHLKKKWFVWQSKQVELSRRYYYEGRKRRRDRKGGIIGSTSSKVAGWLKDVDASIKTNVLVPIKLKVKTFPTDPIQVANIFQVLARQLDTRFALLFETVHSKLEEETANEHDDDLRFFGYNILDRWYTLVVYLDIFHDEVAMEHIESKKFESQEIEVFKRKIITLLASRDTLQERQSARKPQSYDTNDYSVDPIIRNIHIHSKEIFASLGNLTELVIGLLDKDPNIIMRKLNDQKYSASLSKSVLLSKHPFFIQWKSAIFQHIKEGKTSFLNQFMAISQLKGFSHFILELSHDITKRFADISMAYYECITIAQSFIVRLNNNRALPPASNDNTTSSSSTSFSLRDLSVATNHRDFLEALKKLKLAIENTLTNFKQIEDYFIKITSQ